MNEGVGSTTVIVVIIVFIAIVSAYLAYNVNYTKAFRMKNKIIALYEEYNGECTSTPVNGEAKSCLDQIGEYAQQIGYSSASLDCDTNPFKPDGSVARAYPAYGYCEYKVKVIKSGDSSVFQDSKDSYYYRILTRIDIRVPIVQNVLDLQILNITGDTKAFVDD